MRANKRGMRNIQRPKNCRTQMWHACKKDKIKIKKGKGFFGTLHKI